MKEVKRQPLTVYLDPRVAKAVKAKAAAAGSSVSAIVNEVLAERLRRDAADRRLIRERRKQPTRPYDEFIAELKRDGLI